jgi:hypothetical protein
VFAIDSYCRPSLFILSLHDIMLGIGSSCYRLRIKKF